MKVYVALYFQHIEYPVLKGVFSTKEKAEQYIKDTPLDYCEWEDVKEYTLDLPSTEQWPMYTDGR